MELSEADLLDRAALERAVGTAAPDAIVNLAGLSHVGESWKRMGDYFRVNVLGTENVLAAAAGPAGGDRLQRRGLRRGAGEPSSRSPRTGRVDPQTPYALTKAAAERLALAHGAVVARSFNMIGAGPGAAISPSPPSRRSSPRSPAASGSRVLEVGNLSARRDFVHVDDGAAAYRLLAEQGSPAASTTSRAARPSRSREALDRLMASPASRRASRSIPSASARPTSPCCSATPAACAPSAGSRGRPWTTPSERPLEGFCA